MGILGIVLLVFFVIIAILLILLVLIQNEEGEGLGGIFAGGGGSAFGSRAGNVLTRATSVLGALFLVISLALALINRAPTGAGVEQAGRALSGETGSEWFMENETPSGTETQTGAAETQAAEPSADPAPESPAGGTAE